MAALRRSQSLDGDRGANGLVDRPEPADWGSRIARTRGAAAQQEWARVYAEFDARFDEAAALPEDRAASALLSPDGRWNAINAISTWANGVELDRLSVQDHARYADSGINSRVLEGYGNLIAAYGGPAGKAGTVAQRIDHSGRQIVVGTSRGDLRARAVTVVTVPTTLSPPRRSVSPRRCLTRSLRHMACRSASPTSYFSR